jgi:hypothetical protein
VTSFWTHHLLVRVGRMADVVASLNGSSEKRRRVEVTDSPSRPVRFPSPLPSNAQVLVLMCHINGPELPGTLFGMCIRSCGVSMPFYGYSRVACVSHHKLTLIDLHATLWVHHRSTPGSGHGARRALTKMCARKNSRHASGGHFVFHTGVTGAGQRCPGGTH